MQRKQQHSFLARNARLNQLEKEIADLTKYKQEDKMNKINENKEKVLKKKMRSLKYQDKKRQLARKRVSMHLRDKISQWNF